MSNTPETDAFITSQDYSPTGHQWRNFTRKLERERDEAREALADWENAAAHVEADHPDEKHCGCVPVLRKLLTDALKDRDEWAAMCGRYKQERDEAREENKNLKLQLGLWEDGNIICEETLGEIKLFEEQIKQALLERNKAYKIAEQAIDALAWFNETNAQRLRAEFDQLKEEVK
jgi:hypothetical protein